MKNLINFIGWFLLAQSLVLGINLNENTRDLEWKVALSFVLFLVGLFIIIKTKNETTRP
jgi:uncharacterized membrane protein